MQYYKKRYYSPHVLYMVEYTCDWRALQAGWWLGLLELKEITDFAGSYLETNPTIVNKYISELIFGVGDSLIDTYLTKIVESLGLQPLQYTIPEYVHLSRIWRYAILKYVMQTNQEPSELLQVVDDIYSDFGYPEDMIPAIWYRQVGNPEYLSLKSDSEREQYLLKQLYVFLERQKELIAQGPSQDTFGFNMKFAPE